MPSDNEVWTMLSQEATQERDAIQRELKRKRIGLECTKATIEIYHQYGERHLCEIGGGESISNQVEAITRIEKELEMRKRVVELIKTQIDSAPQVEFDSERPIIKIARSEMNYPGESIIESDV